MQGQGRPKLKPINQIQRPVGFRCCFTPIRQHYANDKCVVNGIDVIRKGSITVHSGGKFQYEHDGLGGKPVHI